MFCGASHVQMKYMPGRSSVSPVSHSVQQFCIQQGNNTFRVPLSLPLAWGSEMTFMPVINADSCMFFVHVIIYNEMLLRFVILSINWALYAGYVNLQKQRSASFTAWKTRRIHLALLNPISSNMFPLIEKQCIEILAVRIYAKMHFPVGLRWYCVHIDKFKRPSSSDCEHAEISSGSSTYSNESTFFSIRVLHASLLFCN